MDLVSKNYFTSKTSDSDFGKGRFSRAIRETFEKLESLSGLEDDWDSYGAKAPREAVFIGAAAWIMDIFLDETPIPDVFPVPNGNIQIEWSQGGLDIEIEVISHSRCRVSYEDLENGANSWEEEVGFDISKLSQAIIELTDRSQGQRAPNLRVVQ